jgi:hypothetical protein
MRVEDQSMDGSTCDRAQVARADAVPWLVRDVMVGRPKTLPGNATAGDPCRFFVTPKMATALRSSPRCIFHSYDCKYKYV